MSNLVGDAPLDLTPGSPEAFKQQNLRLPQHLQLSITNRIELAVEEAGHSDTATELAIAKRAANDVIELVARYIDGREVSMLAGLQSASFHVGKIQRMIRERRP